MTVLRRLLLCLPAIGLAALTSQVAAAQPNNSENWISLFNGRDLSGWVPKFNHHPVGVNYRDTFSASGGVLRASYSKYPKFGNEFGHLYYMTPFSSYRLRLDYRFVGTDVAGAPSWAKRNSGVMIHSQSPESVGKHQPFPISVEVQLLNGIDGEVRPTGNVCTPGTSITVEGEKLTTHCKNSKSRTFTGDKWVHLEIEVRGSSTARTFINGEQVFGFDKVEIDPTDLRAMELYLKSGAESVELGRGYIALQAEGHPIEFRKIELLKLTD